MTWHGWWWRRPEHTDRTREVIAEAEETRAELRSLTFQLRKHVSDLRERVRAEHLRHHPQNGA